MRAIVATVLCGVLLGVGLGVGIGKFKSNYRFWTPQMEVNSTVKAATAAVANAASTADACVDCQRGPRVEVVETSFDFGILEKNAANEKGEHPFKIKNVGDETLTLANGGKGCFCTDFEISHKSLRPGETATVLFKWDAARSGGVFNQGVRVLTNDPQTPEVDFAVRGLYTAPIVCEPNEISFQNASATTETTRSFRLFGFEHNDDGTPFPLEILGVEVADSARLEFQIEKADLAELTDKERSHNLFSNTTNLFKGVATLKPGTPQGAFQEIVRVRTNSPKTPVLEIVVGGQVAGNTVRLSGRRYDDKGTGYLTLDSVSSRETTEEKLRLTIFDKIPTNAETVRVKSVRPAWLEVEFAYPPEELQKSAAPVRMVDATVRVPAGSPQGAFMGPSKEQLGEIVFAVGETPETTQEIVLPVRFAVGP
ncbi:MAG: DUF1573 domain-containing protein [Thermoguttaceae bacterium]|nr:DUF1573 domain-containing protein [Thermoguttaceae bacterium]